MSKDVKRLFQSFQPRHYILDLKPDREAMTFSGSVIISGQKLGRPSQRLTFHQKDLTITGAHIVRHDLKRGDVEFSVDRINTHAAYDEVRLHTTEMLYPGLYTVRLEFKGVISRQMNGMYPCFFEHKGTKKQLIATQFESHHAREVFPCVDEPEAKATFDLTLTTPAHETVIANTPIKTQKTHGKVMTTVFETTPHMSTYLLAFVYGELKHLESKTKDGVKVRTYATPDNVAFTKFALDVAVKILEFYNDYFGIPYPLEKCDMIALPDFASGAMENWGCITYREHAMLVDPHNTSLSSKQYVAMVVAHELAHQWFGNLVTMRWWTDLWLNEGFASWIEYLAVDHLFPEWHMWTQFLVDEQQQALKLDALEHTHPIEVPVHHPDEIRTIFDAISYSKGASVIHMLHDFLGAEAFRDGLRHYLASHSYKNTDTVDLWQALEDVSGKPVREFMHAWTTQAGFPLLSATITEHTVSLAQQRFFTNPLHHGGKKPVTWPIALLSHHDGLPAIFEDTEASFKVSDLHSLKLNRGLSGFYRVAYNATHLEKLGTQIRTGHIAPADRLGILSDLFETAKAGQTDTVDALHFLRHFSNEDDYAVWDVIVSAIGSLRMVMDDEDLRELMKPYIRSLIEPQYKRLGWKRKTKESHFDQLLRPIILGLAASADHPEAVLRCRELFASLHHSEDLSPDLKSVATPTKVKRGSDIDPDLRGTVFGTIARLGGADEFDKLLKLHNESTLSEERTTIAAALTGFQQPELIERSLALIDSEHVRLQDVSYWVAYSFMNRHAKQATWNWMKDHWDWLHKNLGTDLSFYRMPIYAARSHSDATFIDEYKAFFSKVMTPAMDRSYRQGIEMLEWQSAWKKRALKEVKAFFKQHAS